jgi:hypothetical protein
LWKEYCYNWDNVCVIGGTYGLKLYTSVCSEFTSHSSDFDVFWYIIMLCIIRYIKSGGDVYVLLPNMYVEIVLRYAVYCR